MSCTFPICAYVQHSFSASAWLASSKISCSCHPWFKGSRRFCYIYICPETIPLKETVYSSQFLCETPILNHVARVPLSLSEQNNYAALDNGSATSMTPCNVLESSAGVPMAHRRSDSRGCPLVPLSCPHSLTTQNCVSVN